MSGSVKRKRTIVRSHWAKLIEEFKTSPLDFYSRVQDGLKRRDVPGLESGLVNWHEGGMISAKRTYLRLARERIVVDLCAAPFGTGFFISWRLGEIPLKIHWISIGLILFMMFIVWITLIVLFDFGLGTMVMSTFITAFVLLLNKIIRQEIEAFYERFFCSDTYYRIDTMLMYEQAVHAAVMEALDEVTSAQGIAPISDKDRKPIMRDVYAK
jgi:hypothetical protein